MIDTITQRFRLKRDYEEVFGTPQGQRVLSHLLSLSGVTRPKFTTDPQQLVWNEAQRHFAMSIFRQVHGSMNRLPDHIKEQLEKQETENHEST